MSVLAVALLALAVPPVPAHAQSTVGNPDPVLRLAPIEPERIRPTPTPGLAVPSVPGRQIFVLRFDPNIPVNLAERPGSLVLHVPHEYARVRADKPAEVWSLVFLLLHPSLKPATPARDRCAQHWCGDEVSVLLQLVPTPQPDAASADVRSRFAAGNGLMTFETVPAPPGYEEAFTGTETIRPDRPSKLFLVYRDKHNEQQVGRCDLDGRRPGCDFHVFDPKTNLLISYTFRMTLLPQRQAIESGLRELLNHWRTTTSE